MDWSKKVPEARSTEPRKSRRVMGSPMPNAKSPGTLEMGLGIRGFDYPASFLRGQAKSDPPVLTCLSKPAQLRFDSLTRNSLLTLSNHNRQFCMHKWLLASFLCSLSASAQ